MWVQYIAFFIFIYYIIVAIRYNRKANKKFTNELNKIAERITEGNEAYFSYRLFVRKEQVMKELQLQFPDWQVLTGLKFQSKELNVEIPPLIVGEKGVLVVSVLEKSGWLSGNQQDAEWQQAFPNKDHYDFANPIIENKKVIGILKETLPLHFQQIFHSIVVFGDESYFADLKITGNEVLITKEETFLTDVTKYLATKPNALSQKEVDMLVHFFSFWKK